MEIKTKLRIYSDILLVVIMVFISIAVAKKLQSIADNSDKLVEVANNQKEKQKNTYEIIKTKSISALYGSLQAEKAEIQIIEDSEKWEEKEIFIIYTFRYKIIKDKKEKNYISETRFNTVTMSSIQIFIEIGEENSIKLKIV